MRFLTIAAGLSISVIFGGAVPEIAQAKPLTLKAAIDGPQRSARNTARDRYRHPLQTLEFFHLRRNQNVVEILPGGGYWSEILAPYLQAKGKYDAAIPAVTGGSAESAIQRKEFIAAFAVTPAIYGKVVITQFPDKIAPDGTADAVLTFRNLHNWMKDGTATIVLADFYRALKPGGVLGIEEHRGRTDQPQDPQAKTGYVREDYAIALIEKAGFKLQARSEINANPKDTKDYPGGVWTLPPTLRLKDQDKAKYLAIGESDRFTLRFVKPR